MNNMRWGIKRILLIFLLIMIGEVIYYTQAGAKEEAVKQVSLIVYGSDATRWERLKQGAELASKDYNAEISLVTMSTENDAMEQISLINREIENGADALMIASCDSDKIDSYLKDKKIDLPYIYVDSGNDDVKETVDADNVKMGGTLAKTIYDNEKDWIKVAIIADNLERNSVNRRLEGLINTSFKYADEIVIWERNEYEKNKKGMFFLQRALTEEAVDVVVALDNSSMDDLLDATINLNKEIKIYGIANTDKAVYYLDNRLIKALVYQDDFSAGYLGVERLFGNKASKKNINSHEIKYSVVRREDIYNDEYQKVLFPFVK